MLDQEVSVAAPEVGSLASGSLRTKAHLLYAYIITRLQTRRLAMFLVNACYYCFLDYTLVLSSISAPQIGHRHKNAGEVELSQPTPSFSRGLNPPPREVSAPLNGRSVTNRFVMRCCPFPSPPHVVQRDAQSPRSSSRKYNKAIRRWLASRGGATAIVVCGQMWSLQGCFLVTFVGTGFGGNHVPVDAPRLSALLG